MWALASVLDTVMGHESSLPAMARVRRPWSDTMGISGWMGDWCVTTGVCHIPMVVSRRCRGRANTQRACPGHAGRASPCGMAIEPTRQRRGSTQ
jgi:hypothetical protein